MQVEKNQIQDPPYFPNAHLGKSGKIFIKQRIKELTRERNDLITKAKGIQAELQDLQTLIKQTENLQRELFDLNNLIIGDNNKLMELHQLLPKPPTTPNPSNKISAIPIK